MGMTSPFPEPESPDLEQYTVYSRAEIVGMLRALADAHVLVTAYFSADPGFGVTTLLAIQERDAALIFDCLSDDAAQRRLLAAPKITFVGFVEAIKVQFTVAGAASVQYEGKPAFRVPLPDNALRLQRRDAFRVRPPLARPATCRVPYGEEGKFETLRIVDISVGGLALLTYPERFELAGGRVIEQCELQLPGVGTAQVTLKVRHVDPVPRDEKARRCGCEFVAMAAATRMLLQRYVNNLDAESRKLAARG